MRLWREPAPGSRRAARRRELLQLRLDGQYGPEWWEVLPGFALLALIVAVPLAGLGWLYLKLGPSGLALGLVLLVVLVIALVRHRQTVLRRRRGHYTLAELGRLDEAGLAEAAARMLRRDGWRVQSAPWAGLPRLLCRHPSGRSVDVTVRPAAQDAVDEPGPASLRAVAPVEVHGSTRLVISTGTYPRADVLWASRQGGVHLVDGQQLQRWAAGTDLLSLIR